MKINRRRKKLRLVFLVLSLSAFAVMTSLAFYSFEFSVANEFTVGSLRVDITETFHPPSEWDGGPVTKEVRYVNAGTAPALLRVAYAESFVSADGVLLSAKREDGTDIVKKNWNTAGGLNTATWTFKDGWYYCNRLLSPGESITILDSIQIEGYDALDAVYRNSDYKLSFSHEYIEVKGETAEELWGVDALKFSVTSDGTISWGFEP